MAFDPNQERDAHGRWTTGGAGASTSVDPRVHSVSGDEWNRATGARLESEYAAVRPALDKLATDAAENGVKVGGISGSTWDDISSDVQDEALHSYEEQNYQGVLDSEIQSWHESDSPLNDAKNELAHDDDWKKEQLAELITDRAANGDPRIPYSPDDLTNAISVEWDDGNKNPKIEFDDSKLQTPDVPGFSKDQLALPGIEPSDPSRALTQEMRDHIAETLTTNFNEKAAKNADDATPPDYLSESASESLQTYWNEMDDSSKFEWTKSNTSLLDAAAASTDGAEVAMPKKFDPLNETSGEDYQRTQALARYLATARAEQVMKERGIGVATTGSIDKYTPSADDINTADHTIWADWKGSSSSQNGKLIQVVAHDELGSRLNVSAKDINPEVIRNYANEEFKDVGGYDGIKAMMRAKWETTQYLMDRANLPTLQAYRGINMASTDPRYINPEGWHIIDASQAASGKWVVKTSDYNSVGEKYDTKEAAEAALKIKNDGLPGVVKGVMMGSAKEQWGLSVGSQPTKFFDTEAEARAARAALPPAPRVENVEINGQTYTKLPDLKVDRNGAASTSTDAHVSNSWGSDNGRVVLRAEVPRTAVISVPAYGINVHSEHEAVVMGTAWHNWDAWKVQAPTFGDHPMKAGITVKGGIETVDVLKAGKAALAEVDKLIKDPALYNELYGSKKKKA